jgi:hypothetical protein
MTSNEKAKLRAELATELGFYPASVDPESIVRHRRQSAEADANHQAYELEYGPGGPKRHRWEHLKRRWPIITKRLAGDG